ncbi:tRNA (guanosine(46)-N7)-methyltransferase TrmB [Aliifodinibius salipaludis]|uniref:tRNA (guanine-N(7)-)-methyltransferase n=1 Tax=Fodinibius salipaludis TaxID=2032627 RepID=A0A2A2G979_9BACT|nr:tRNA (guanosine(46)-N7)-methyltransferase TrmB [Aliifodinibius salipaludis]PAU93564.1 tRNA (guanosine(46)-N7)-methyltransferase TrmB [Aliifodinibius salipaludis]
MSKGKLKKFKEVTEFPNTLELTDFQNEKSQKPKGRWHSDIFENDNPMVLELACGKGTYTLELARRNPNKNFVGVDIKGHRIWKGANQALEEGLDNVRFLRIYIDHLDEYFGPDEVDDIWITFPDPYPLYSDRNKRLSGPKFLKIYQRVLKKGGAIRFKTDSNELFTFTKESVRQSGCEVHDVVEEIYQERPDDELLTIQTHFERRHLEKGRTISLIKFSLPVAPITWDVK